MSSPWSITYWWPLALVVLLPYVVGPIVIWLTFRLRAYSKFEVIDSGALPANVQRYFASLAPELVQDGFVVACYLHNTGTTAGVEAYIVSWINRERGQGASAVAVVPALGMTKLSLTFGTVLAPHGRTINTTNYGSDAGIFEQRDWLDTARVPWVTSPRELYQVHLNRERRLVPADATRYVPTPEETPRACADAAAHEVREQVRAGLLRETGRAGEVGVTWRGAWLVVIRLLPPMKQIRLWQARRRSRHDYADARTSPAPPPIAPRVTHESPFVRTVPRFPLDYA